MLVIGRGLLINKLKKENECSRKVTLRNILCYSSSHEAFASVLLLVRPVFHFKMKNSSKIQNVEPEKVIAERINGWAAMLGCIAAIGAYLTTGQIIPGFV